MDVSFQTFKEFLAHNDSGSSDDEVFIGAKYNKIHYAKQKTEELDFNLQATSRKSVITSEDYFADQSRLSSRGQDKGELRDERLNQSSDSVFDEQEPCARTLDTGLTVDRTDVLGTCPSNSSDPSMRLPSDFAPDEHNISFRSSSRFTRILSFQRFSSADYLASSGNEMESRKTDSSKYNPDNIPATVDLQLPVDEEESNLHQCAESDSRNDLALKCGEELTGGQNHCSPSLPGHAVFLSVADLPLDQSTPDCVFTHDTHDRSSNPANVSPCATDLQDNTSPSPVDRSMELPQQHNSDFNLAGENDHMGEDEGLGPSLASGSSSSILGHSVLAPSTDKDHEPSLIDCGLRTSRHSDLIPQMNVLFDQVINKHCEVWLNGNMSRSKTAVANSMFLQMGSPLCKEFSPREASTITKTPEDCEGLKHKESLGRKKNDNLVTDPRASDFALGDVCLPSILVDHFENCLVEEEQIEDTPAPRERPSLNNSLNLPGCSGVALLRLPTETSDSEGFTSDSDSDCNFNLEVMRRWNQHLEDQKAIISTGPVEKTSPHAAMPLCRGQSSNSCELEKRSGTNRLSTVVQSPTASTLKQTEAWENSTGHIQRLHKEFGLDLEIGQGSSSARRPSPLVLALQLTPTRFGGQEEPSPSNLESLDLSVDDRIPVNRYFAVMDKENRSLEGKKRLPEKKKTPSKPGVLPMREISNSPVIGKSPEFAAPRTRLPTKKTGIPVIETRIDAGRHARCFNLYSTNRLQELKAKSMKDFQHISSPVSKYIREYPVSPFIQNIRPKVMAFQKNEKCMPVKTFFPPPTPLATNLPVARYTEKNPVPRTVEKPPPKFKYFPSPNTPLVIKHTGPSHVIPDTSCLRGEESVLSSGCKGSRIPHFRDTRTTREVDESVWEVVSPKMAARK